MTKRVEFDFLGLYQNILKDIEVYFPDDRRQWEKDFLTLTRLSSTRGQSTFTIDLPALGKILDRSLADGRLAFSSTNLSRRRRKGSVIPRLFQGLWSRLFDDVGCLKASTDPNVVLFLRTLLYVGKNLEWECAPRYLFEATEEFYRVEADLPIPSSFWEEDLDWDSNRDIISFGDILGSAPNGDLYPSGNESLRPVLDSIQRSCDRVSGIIGFYEPDDNQFRHGPGAVSDASGGSYKYDFPNWPPRLEAVFPFFRYGSTITGFMDRLQPSGLDLVSHEPRSKLIAVPKTQKGPRLIASEPTAHQWCQQSIGGFLQSRVARSCLSLSLDFFSQDPSRRLARASSLDGSYSTIDLKSASDRLSCWFVQRAFRKNPVLLVAMRACRTRYISNDIDSKQPSLHKLRKFTTQGSALTFPVQSLCFLSVALGVGKHLMPHLSWQDIGRQVRVFGDDIIVPREWEPLLSTVLEVLYLKVNRTKTFSNGYFRESCGMDAWMGYDVTPPHVTMRAQESDPRTIASNVAVSNNFFLKGFWVASEWLRSTVRDKFILVSKVSSGAFGFKSFSGTPIPPVSRWNKDLHRDEFRALVIMAKARKMKQETAAALLQYFTEEPEPYVKYESGVAVAGVPVKRHVWVPLDAMV